MGFEEKYLACYRKGKEGKRRVSHKEEKNGFLQSSRSIGAKFAASEYGNFMCFHLVKADLRKFSGYS